MNLELNLIDVSLVKLSLSGQKGVLVYSQLSHKCRCELKSEHMLKGGHENNRVLSSNVDAVRN